jgi:hypothetical protein
MPRTSDVSARDAISEPLQQQTMQIMQPRDTPLHINHSTWLLMRAGHFIFVYHPLLPKLAKIGSRDLIPHHTWMIRLAAVNEARSHDL